MSLLRAGIAGLWVAFLVGCSQVIVYGDGNEPAYFQGDFQYATRGGAIRTEVVGAPFEADPQKVENVVLALMSGRNFGRPVDFVATNSERTDPVYKVVVAFNVAPGYSGYTLCRSTEGLPMRESYSPATVQMAFCFGDQPKSDVRGRVDRVTGFDDPKFAELIQQTLLSLYPLTDEHNDNDESRTP